MLLSLKNKIVLQSSKYSLHITSTFQIQFLQGNDTDLDCEKSKRVNFLNKQNILLFSTHGK